MLLQHRHAGYNHHDEETNRVTAWLHTLVAAGDNNGNGGHNDTRCGASGDAARGTIVASEDRRYEDGSSGGLQLAICRRDSLRQGALTGCLGAIFGAVCGFG